ncbi:energy-coupling factor transporter ATPase [Convivina praedatoris]|uniref:Energy-coupling factor transporter ATP-binding protein EcfA2 n=1 Tax=Convivina praedatoris TaxID=2880963 RepID=A0ABN8HFD5_9LACO|nr:energy-coupling factor transporter ATPase [Convivina sp. LMG 32447]CAH1856135.1 Energy-coupling factor transporter ATP-binding protein EcfA2 [Convivina sp. LMG 32447]CAH1856383.1 Energy-coupling factor transporter ATP-binding protein EcfA2 [Convivina sp. LMG 32447]CAH1856996.1 Energy-coupling factor transporter ATP-binding protein EcfA2 [Convivina sp. LMG 32447]
MAITFEQVNFSYGQGSLSQPILKDISTTIPSGKITAIIGQTGSGKSTLVQHINGLLKPTNGKVIINDFELTSQTKEKQLVALRAQVGMVFQFPESQLFANTVLEDVMYGSLNFGQDHLAAKEAAQAALTMVGLPSQHWDKSPFALSGGQMRRVAIAGTLALNPPIIVLDEPAAGLDPLGQAELVKLMLNLKKQDKTVVLISHQMDQVMTVADWTLVMHQGQVIAAETPTTLFNRPLSWFKKVHLDLPTAGQFAQQLMAQGWQFKERPLTLEQLAQAINQEVTIHE